MITIVVRIMFESTGQLYITVCTSLQAFFRLLLEAPYNGSYNMGSDALFFLKRETLGSDSRSTPITPEVIGAFNLSRTTLAFSALSPSCTSEFATQGSLAAGFRLDSAKEFIQRLGRSQDLTAFHGGNPAVPQQVQPNLQPGSH